MKTFLIKILKFSFFCIFISICFYFLISFFYYNKINSLKLDDNINTLILGDSQTQCAISDSIYKNSVNYSLNSEHYLYTLNVLKLVVEKNPQIRNLILGCAYHNISTYNDRFVLGEKKEDRFATVFYPRYFSILDKDGKIFLMKNNLPGLVMSSRKIVVNMINSLTHNYTNYQDYPFIGKFYPGKRRVLNDTLIENTVLWHFYTDDTGTQLEDISQLQLKYLNEIISFCKENNIKVFLINTPIHEDYYKQIPLKFKSGLDSLMKQIGGNNDNVEILDYHDQKFLDDYFGDGNHLNIRGAALFTPVIMDKLNSK